MSNKDGGMSAGAQALAWVGIISLAAFLFSYLLAIWLAKLDAAKGFLDVIKVLFGWPVIAGGLAAAGAHKFRNEIAERLARPKHPTPHVEVKL